MQNGLKLVALALFVVAGFFVFSTHGTSVNAAAIESESSPRSLYVSNCARCHGTNGRAQTAQGKKLDADDLTGGDATGISDAKMTRVITSGKGKMPSFRKKLTAAQIAQISSYVRSL